MSFHRLPLRAASCGGLALLACGSLAHAQESTRGADPPHTTRSGARVLTATRITEPPVVDGTLNERAWSQAEAAGDFIQRTPRDGEPATQETRFQILFDDQALYVGVWLLDTDPEAALGRSFAQVARDHRIIALWQQCREQGGERIEPVEVDRRGPFLQAPTITRTVSERPETVRHCLRKSG